MSPPIKNPSVCIVGAGFSGICGAVKWKMAFGTESLNRLEVFEMMEDLGGTWLTNCYPGAACDAPIHLYTYSFEPRYHWTDKFAKQPEILEYLKDVSRKHKILDRIHLRHQVVKVEWDVIISKWRVLVKNLDLNEETEREFDIVILGTGLLRNPKIPEQFQQFKGKMFHTSRWDPTVNLTDKRVAVVGVGSSGIQVIPEIAKIAETVLIYQRRPGWVIPKETHSYSSMVRRMFRCIPWLQTLHRSSIFRKLESFWQGFVIDSPCVQQMSHQSKSYREAELAGFPDLEKKLTPKDPFGCQRLLFSTDYYETLKNPSVKLINSKIENVTEDGIVTSEGEEKIDILVSATGFNVDKFFSPIEIVDKNGRNLLDMWKECSPELLLGITGNNLPNLFFLWGPNSTLSHNSVVLMMELQMDWIIKCNKWKQDENATTLAVKKSVVEAYMVEIREDLKRMIWSSPNCNPPTQYVDEKGQLVAQYPGTVQSYRQRIRNFRKNSLEFA